MASKAKAKLAVVLAHSLLQLHESEWLCRNWGKEHILFLRNGGVTFVPSAGFGLDRPYVSTGLFPSKAPYQGPPDNETFKNTSHPIPSLMALGIVVLELHLNASIESRPAHHALDVGMELVLA